MNSAPKLYVPAKEPNKKDRVECGKDFPDRSSVLLPERFPHPYSGVKLPLRCPGKVPELSRVPSSRGKGA